MLAELPVILAATAYATEWSVRQVGVPSQVVQRLLMGGIAFVLVQMAELGLWMTMGLSPDAYVTRLSTPAGSVGLMAQTLVVVIPVSLTRS
ncbi:MAG: hypothetical protein EXR52_08735 [Dehalococcoidia bacterium]|nr:hypothetical protein [Dehalococcoidia bacterium]